MKLSRMILPHAIALRALKKRNPPKLTSVYCASHAPPRGKRTKYGRRIPVIAMMMRNAFTVFRMMSHNREQPRKDESIKNFREILHGSGPASSSIHNPQSTIHDPSPNPAISGLFHPVPKKFHKKSTIFSLYLQMSHPVWHIVATYEPKPHRNRIHPRPLGLDGIDG